MRLPRPVQGILLGLTILVLLGGSAVAGVAIYDQRQAAQLQQQDEATLALKAALRASATSTDEFVSLMREFVRARPDEARGHTLLGGAYLQKARESADPGYYTRAEASLQRAIALNPEDSDALTSMGELALARHRFAEAIGWGERSWAINPHKARTLGVIGDGQLELGRYDEAFATFQRMIDLRPDLSSYARAAYARELVGDLDGAIEAMQAAVGASAPFGENTAYVQVQLGHLYLGRGQVEEAHAAYQRAMRVYPASKQAQAGVARVLAARGDLAGAIALYKDVIDVVPLPEYVIALGDLYRANGQAAEAARADQLVRAMGTLFQANGVDMNIDLAMFDAERGQNLPATIDLARRVYTERPSVKVAAVLAWALYQDGKYDEAWTASQQARRLGTKDALLHYQAGMIAARRGDQVTAIGLLDAALTQNPAFSPLHAPEARRTLDSLRLAAGQAAPAPAT